MINLCELGYPAGSAREKNQISKIKMQNYKVSLSQMLKHLAGVGKDAKAPLDIAPFMVLGLLSQMIHHLAPK